MRKAATASFVVENFQKIPVQPIFLESSKDLKFGTGEIERKIRNGALYNNLGLLTPFS